MLVVSMKQKYFVHYYIVGYVSLGKKQKQQKKSHKNLTNQQLNSSEQMGMFHSQVCGTFAWIPGFHSYDKLTSGKG